MEKTEPIQQEQVGGQNQIAKRAQGAQQPGHLLRELPSRLSRRGDS